MCQWHRVLVVTCSLLAASCSSSGTDAPADGASSQSSASNTDATQAAPGATTPASTSTTVPTQSLPTEPATPSDLPQLEIRAVDDITSEAQFLGDIDVLSVAGQLADSGSLLVVEQRGSVEEGCEGGLQPLGRLALIDIDSGSGSGSGSAIDGGTGNSATSTPLTDLELTDSRVVLGPNNMIAVIGGCDANAWLAAVGQIDADGSLTLRRLSAEVEDRVNASNNAGVSVTWTSDGSVLFVDTTRVDATTGERLDSADPSTMWVHAELADGTRLVSTERGSGGSQFWVVDADTLLEFVPDTEPDLVAQAFYPAVQVRIDAEGERGYAIFEDWEAGGTHSVMFSSDGLFAFDGRVEPSPTGVRLLVETGDFASGDLPSWSVVDLATNTSFPVVLPVEQADTWITVQWGGSENELLVSSQPNLGVAPTSMWLIPLAGT